MKKYKSFSFFYVLKNVVQKSMIPGVPDVTKAVEVDGHIIHSGRLMCGESREVVKNRVPKNAGTKESNSRLPKIPLCSTCEQAWKKHPDSDWAHWVAGSALKGNKEVISGDIETSKPST